MADRLLRSCPNVLAHGPHDWDFVRHCPGVEAGDEVDVVRCDICEKEVAPGEFVGLDRVAPNHYVVVKRGVKEGDILDCDVWAHDSCLQEKGRYKGMIPVGQG